MSLIIRATTLKRNSDVILMSESTKSHQNYHQRTDKVRFEDNSIKQPENTKRSTNTWEKQWSLYKSVAGWDFDDGKVSKPILARAAADFLAQIKPTKIEEYKDSSIVAAFAGLSRYFKLIRKEIRTMEGFTDNDIDLSNDIEFEMVRDAREARVISLQEQGHTGTESASALTVEEEAKLLDCAYFSIENPEGLARKVFFVLTLCLLGRGKSSQIF
jgi:hypothetical protein